MAAAASASATVVSWTAQAISATGNVSKQTVTSDNALSLCAASSLHSLAVAADYTGLGPNSTAQYAFTLGGKPLFSSKVPQNLAPSGRATFTIAVPGKSSLPGGAYAFSLRLNSTQLARSTLIVRDATCATVTHWILRVASAGHAQWVGVPAGGRYALCKGSRLQELAASVTFGAMRRGMPVNYSFWRDHSVVSRSKWTWNGAGSAVEHYFILSRGAVYAAGHYAFNLDVAGRLLASAGLPVVAGSC